MLANASVSEAEKRWLRVLGTLNESQARLFVAERALALGRGGISRLARLTGMSRPAIARGAAELQGQAPLLPAAAGRIRQVGSGRRKVEDVDPKVRRHLTRILDGYRRLADAYLIEDRVARAKPVLEKSDSRVSEQRDARGVDLVLEGVLPDPLDLQKDSLHPDTVTVFHGRCPVGENGHRA